MLGGGDLKYSKNHMQSFREQIKVIRNIKGLKMKRNIKGLKMKKYKWANIVPLVGGSNFGCYKSTGTKPLYHLSYDAFEKNESFLEKYWPEIPRIVINENLKVPDEEIDFVNSVCPCAGLSALSTAKTNSKSRANANQWMFESAENVLGKVKPKVYWGENAPGLFTGVGEDTRNKLYAIAKKHDYSISFYKTSTSFHGVPQYRNRTFYFFWNSKFAPIMNWYDKEKKPLVEFLKEIPKDASGQNKSIREEKLIDNHSYQFTLYKSGLDHPGFMKANDGPNKGVHAFYSWIARNGHIDEAIEWIESKHNDSPDAKRLKSIKLKLDDGKNFWDNSPAFFYSCTNALVGRCLQGICHPEEARFMNVREIMHLMGMPSDFEFIPGKDNATLGMLAQNVPASTAKDMCDEVLKYIDGKLEFSENDFLMQNNFKKKIL